MNLTLIAGQEMVVTATQFKQSVVLQKAQQTNQIAVRWSTPMSKKSIKPPYVRHSRKPKKATTPNPQATKSNSQISEEVIKSTIQKEVAQMKSEIVGEISKLLAQGATLNAENLGQMINQAVQENMPKVVHSSSSSSSDTGIVEDEPIYIPSDITNSGTIQGGSVSVSSVSSEDTSLDDATAALRAMRKNRRTKK